MKVKFKLDKQKSPTTQQGMKVTYGEAKRAGYRLRWLFLLGSILAPSIIAIYFLLKPQLLTIAPGVVTYHPVALTVSQNSTVDEIEVGIGDEVTKNSVLLSLSNDALNSEIAYLENEISKLEHLLSEQGDTRIILNEKAVQDANRNFLQVTKIKKKYDKYNTQGQVSTSDYVAVLTSYSLAEKQLSEAKLELSEARLSKKNELVSGEIAKAIRNLEIQLVVKKEEQNELVLRAPFDARVIDIEDIEGRSFLEDDHLVTVADSSQPPEIQAYLDAEYVDKAKLNGEAVVVLPNGDEYEVLVSKPTELAAKLPAHLAKPYEGQQALMQVSLSFVNLPSDQSELIEGMPVEVHF
ncbi:permease [Vibrio inusitatus NBRC 102082]|uniref:Permease n=1 Tax=Vibrio inusitatus NBRC 102082 TaxID=1219070 RepID=A0A4Y3HTA3_9VIBR|nr:hypothetical protein [Vibrio inusitatus]GEA50245.1 permease [Vibrio inusitatus NBRC 102082]